MTHTDLTNTANTDKTNIHNKQSKDTKTEESSSDVMNNMEYFSVFGFLLAGLANYAYHDKQMSD